MKHILITLALLALNAIPLSAETLEEKVAYISECLNDVSRLEEGHQLLEQMLSTKDIGQQPVYPQLLYLQSYYHMNSGDFARAKQELLALQDFLPAKGYDELSISVPQDLGVCYRREGQNDSALYYYDQALQAALAQQDLEWQAAINLNIGILHFNLNHITEAEQFLERAISLVRQVDDPYTELCALQVNAAVKQRLKKYDEARANIEPAYRLALESESPDWQLRCLTVMLPTYYELQLPDSAAVALQQGDALLPLLPAQSITAIGYITARGDYYMQNEQWQKAADDLNAVLSNDMAGVRTQEGYIHLAYCYEHLGQWQQAYRFMDSARVSTLRTGEENFAQQMADFNVRYQTVEKDLEISRLHEQRTRTTIITVAIFIVLALLLLGLWLWQRHRHYRREAQLRIDTLETERRRIARELHDGLCNDLLALEMQCASGLKPDEATTRLCQLRLQARALSHQLMPPDFEYLSLAELLETFAQQTSEKTNLDISFFKDIPTTQQFSADISHELYRIVQEYVANIVKGGTATHVNIGLTAERLTIEDDGKPTPSDKPGIGQRTMHDRALSIGATISTKKEDSHNLLTILFNP